MTGRTGGASPLDAGHAAFIQGGVSVILASRNAELLAVAVRGCGCRVSRDLRRVTVLVDRERAVAAAHRTAWVDELGRNGYSHDFAEAFWGRLPEAMAAVAFTPTATFQQTPGPAAGQPLDR